MRYLFASKLSEHILETPEGYLLCLDVPIARTGVMEYRADSFPEDFSIEAGPDGRILVTRLPEDVFAPEAMASLEGKPTTIDHPDDDVTPLTWKELARGHAQNLRQGTGAESDLLLADLLINDKEAIDLVRGGLREISCGYDADYEQEAPGRGWQRNIRGNHIALVRRGRCGPRCKINDNHEGNMSTTKTKTSFSDRLLAALGSAKARRVLDEAMAETPEDKPKTAPADGDKTAPATDEGEDRMAALEAKVDELGLLLRQLLKGEQAEAATDNDDAGAGTEDEEDPGKVTKDEDQPENGGTKTGDSAGGKRRARTTDTRTVDADTKARAAILHPGLQVHDSDKGCTVKRAALRMAMKDRAVDAVLQAALRGSTLDSCDCVTLDAAFVAASEVAKARNNTRTGDALSNAHATITDFGKATSPADINAANAAFYKKG